MAYLVLLRFNSQQNVDMFLRGPQSTPLHAEEVIVPSGYTPPAPGLGSPGSSAVSNPKFIVLSPDTLSQIPQGYQPLIIYDLSPSTGPTIVGPVSPTIDPSQLTVKGGPTFDNTIINQGIPSTNYTDQIPPPTDLPFPFEPIWPTPNYMNPDLPDLFPPPPYEEHPPQSEDYVPDPPPIPWKIDPNVLPDVFPPYVQPISDQTIELPEIDVIAPPPGEGWQQVPGDQFETIAPRPPVYVRPLPPLPGTGEGGGAIRQGALFVALQDAIITGIDTVTQNPQFWYSFNGISWNLALTTNENQAQNVTLKFGNGTWMAAVNWESIPGGNQNIDSTDFFFSTNGISWSVVFTLGASTTSSTFNNFGVGSANNGNSWQIDYALNNGPTQHFLQASPFSVNSAVGDKLSAFPGNSWSGTNTLPDSFKNVGVGNITPLTFNYTLDGTTWVPTMTFVSTVTIFYGP